MASAYYYERRGIVCVWNEDAITIANPGDFRVPVDEARRPGVSDPRNETMLRMFSMVEVGERAGSGLSKILAGWAEAGYDEPFYAEEFGPDRTTLTLPLTAGQNDSADTERSRPGDFADSILEFRR